ncbi:MAG: hypothetical protein RBU37_17790 [Myxococcota bacterium]|nr:hypothetical protein [Myxococcota bacterium]
MGLVADARVLDSSLYNLENRPSAQSTRTWETGQVPNRQELGKQAKRPINKKSAWRCACSGSGDVRSSST